MGKLKDILRPRPLKFVLFLLGVIVALWYVVFLLFYISTESVSPDQRQGKEARSGRFSSTQSWRTPEQLGEKEERTAMQIGKEEVKLSLFADNMILYVKNSKESTHTHKKKAVRTHKRIFSKVAEYKIAQKSIIFLPLTVDNRKRKLRKQLYYNSIGIRE